MTPVTAADLRASQWTRTFIDFRGGWQRRMRCRDYPVEAVATGRRGVPSVWRWLVHDVDVGGTIEEAVAALNDWSIVQRALDAESAHNNVDDGDLYGTRRKRAAAKAAAEPKAADMPTAAKQGSFEFTGPVGSMPEACLRHGQPKGQAK